MVEYMSSEELERRTTAEQVEEASVDSSTQGKAMTSELTDNKVDLQSNSRQEAAHKEPIDWFSVFLIVLVLANIGYWLATRNRVMGPDMRVFLASPSEQTFPINDDKKMAPHGMLPPEVKSQIGSSSSQVQRELTQPQKLSSAEPTSEQSASKVAQSSEMPKQIASSAEKLNNNEFSHPIEKEKAQPSVDISEPKEQNSSENISESDLFLASEELPKAPFAPYFKGKPLEVSTAYKSGVSHEIKRDFLVNQYMYAAEVLDRYRADTKPIFDCDANAQKFSVSGDNEAELRAVQQTIKVSADLLRKTYNNEVAKALAKTKLKGKELEQVKKEAGEAEALLNISFSRSAEKYEDVLRRLKAQ